MRGGVVTLFLSGDVMLGRGVDQILPHPGDPRLYEAFIRNARIYIDLAEAVNGPIACPVDFTWPWGDALQVLDDAAPDVRVVNLETSITRSGTFAAGKAVHYRMNPANIPCLAVGRPDVCALANNHVLDFGRQGLGDTLDALADAGLPAAGAGRDAGEARRPTVVTVEAADAVEAAEATSEASIQAREVTHLAPDLLESPGRPNPAMWNGGALRGSRTQESPPIRRETNDQREWRERRRPPGDTVEAASEAGIVSRRGLTMWDGAAPRNSRTAAPRNLRTQGSPEGPTGSRCGVPGDSRCGGVPGHSRRGGLGADGLGADLMDVRIRSEARDQRESPELRRPPGNTVEGGRRVLVFSFGMPSSGIPAGWAATRSRAGIDIVGEASDAWAAEIAGRVRRAKRLGDVAVVSVHWGSNWGYDVSADQVRFAHGLIDGGIDVVHGHSSHHPRPVEVYRDKLVLYGCGDFIDDYEGISGYERYRDDLRLLYFVSVDPGTGELAGLRMVPMQARQMRLRHASREDSEWLRGVLERAGSAAGFGSRFCVEPTGALSLRRA